MLSANYQPDSSATIALKTIPNELVYTFNSPHRTNWLFSLKFIMIKVGMPISTIKNVPYFRADYLLRAMPLKAGNYEITFRFEPNSYKMEIF